MNYETEKKLAKAVKAGAKLLDKRKKNWFKKISIKRLEMSDCDKCVLGQLYGDFTRGTEKLWPNERWFGDLLMIVRKYGFDGALGEVSPENYAGLRILWTKAIRKRKKKAAA